MGETGLPASAQGRAGARRSRGFFRVTETGDVESPRVNRTTDERFNDAALAAVAQWKFTPGRKNQQAAAMDMRVRVVFKLPEPDYKLRPPDSELPALRKLTPAEPRLRSEAVYPEYLLDRALVGRIDVEYEVTAEGRVGTRKILGCNDTRFIPAAMDVLDRWTFEPAKQGDLPVTDKKRSAIGFAVEISDPAKNNPEGLLAANGFALVPEEGRTTSYYCNRPPELIRMVDPVYPQARALAGEAGEVTLSFTLTKEGRPTRITAETQAGTDWAYSAMAALASCQFEPAYQQSQAVEVPMRLAWKFIPPAHMKTAHESPRDELIRRQRAGEKPTSAKTLDQPIKPAWIVSAIYPETAVDTPPSALVKVTFVIDREGRVQLPAFNEAPSPEIGWAAVTAVSQYVFNRPTQQGAPTDVRIALNVAVERKPTVVSSISR